MLLSTSSCLRQGLTHVTDTGRCPTPCPNPTEVVQLGQLFFCCSRSGVSPSSRACSVLFPALRLSRAAVCAATKPSVRCSQDLSDLRTASVLHPDRRGEPVVTGTRDERDPLVDGNDQMSLDEDPQSSSIEYFPGAAQTYRGGSTFIDKFHADEFSNHRA